MIQKRGGNIIKKDCENYIRANGRLPTDEAFIGSSGRLMCHRVIHAVGKILHTY